jgi:hypothetical protein
MVSEDRKDNGSVRSGFLRVIAVPRLVHFKPTGVAVELDVRLYSPLREDVRVFFVRAWPPSIRDVIEGGIVEYTGLNKTVGLVTQLDLEGPVVWE